MPVRPDRRRSRQLHAQRGERAGPAFESDLNQSATALTIQLRSLQLAGAVIALRLPLRLPWRVGP